MKIIIHNLLHETQEVFEGDANTIERALEKDFSWAVKYSGHDLNRILAEIDRHQFFGVEVVDAMPHPFLKG